MFVVVCQQISSSWKLEICSPRIREICQDFLDHPVFVRCVGVSALSGCRWRVSGGFARTCNRRAGVVADRVWRLYYSAGSDELREGSVVCGRTIFGQWHISPPACTCDLRRRSRVILATGVNRPVVGYLSRSQRREFWEIWTRERFD